MVGFGYRESQHVNRAIAQLRHVLRYRLLLGLYFVVVVVLMVVIPR